MRSAVSRLGVLTFALIVGGIIAAPAEAVTSTVSQGNITVKLLPFVTIPSADGAATDLVSADDGTGRLFITTRNGKVRLVNSAGTFLDTSAAPFLNLSSAVGGLYTAGEGGLLSIAFSRTDHTKFYTFDTQTFSTSTTPVEFSHPELRPTTTNNPTNHIFIREWQISAGNANLANTAFRRLMTINHPQSNHQGGDVKIGFDNMLYISLGDGGGGNDFNGSKGSSSDGHSNTAGNGQDTGVVFGKILRIDPNGSNSGNGQYGIPAGQPFGGITLPEIYAYGLRNPYRLAFDRAGTHELYVADVGQDTQEEVDRIATGGGNYGWPHREGDTTNSNWPGGPASIAPIGSYANNVGSNTNGGNSIIGGFVYRGSLIPELYGKYVFGDLHGANSGKTIGKLFYMDAAGTPGSNTTVFELKYNLTGGGLAPSMLLYGFGENANGELYALFSDGNTNHQILQIIPEPASLGAMLMLIPLARRRRFITPRSAYSGI